MGKVRLAPPTRLGGPKGPVNPWPVRVSTTRQGVMPTNTSEFAGLVASNLTATAFILARFAWLSSTDGCQYKRACQGLSGTISDFICHAAVIGISVNSRIASRPLRRFIEILL